jgi:hypothetical protein
MTEAQAQPPATTAPAAPRSWLGYSILALFVFLPTGIVALVYSLRTRSRWEAGDVAAARASSTRARTWALSTLVVGLALLALVVILGLVYGSNDLNTYP